MGRSVSTSTVNKEILDEKTALCSSDRMTSKFHTSVLYMAGNEMLSHIQVETWLIKQ